MTPENTVKVVSVIKRYRDETPLGHQPHMLAHLADEALAIMEAEQAIPKNCGSGHCSCIECFKEDAKDAVDAAWGPMIHYPECWDTAAYPTLGHAVHEALAWTGCSVCGANTDEPDYQAKCAELELAHEALDRAELDAARYRQLLLYRGFRVAKMFDIGYGNYTPLEEVVRIIGEKLDEEMEQSK